MPKILAKRKRPLKSSERIERNRAWRVTGYGEFIDPYPHIMGTLPEKKVYAYLMQNGIAFNYQTYLHTVIPEIGFDKWYRPDFIIPSLKIIIEVQGAYWHSTPEAQKDDAFKQAIFEYLGWKVLTWWDYEIEYKSVAELATEDPRLAYYTGKRVGEVITEHKEYRDDSAGIRKVNSLRSDYAKKTAKIKQRSTRKKSIVSYGVTR